MFLVSPVSEPNVKGEGQLKYLPILVPQQQPRSSAHPLSLFPSVLQLVSLLSSHLSSHLLSPSLWALRLLVMLLSSSLPPTH